MKKQAWTLAELTVAITVLIILSTIAVSNVKPNMQKASVFVYSTLKNLNLGHSSIIEKYAVGNLYPTEGKTHDQSQTTDWYCLNLADVFSLKSTPNCADNAAIGVANLTLINGVTLQGIASAWKEPYAGANFLIKDFVIDIDGNKGKNRVGIDRFPMRVYAGSAKDGIIQPVNCVQDKDLIYDGNTPYKQNHPYCFHGYTPGTTRATNNMLTESEIISYTIYRARENINNSKTDIIKSKASTLEADCSAYGGKGFFSEAQCNAAGLSLHPKCAKYETCADCKSGSTYNVCPIPEGGTNKVDGEAACVNLAATTNPNETPCFSVQQKPTGGMGFLAGAILGDIDY